MNLSWNDNVSPHEQIESFKERIVKFAYALSMNQFASELAVFLVSFLK